VLTYGAPLPAEGAKALFWTEYNDFFAFGKSLTMDGYLSWGAGNIVLSKLSALGQNLQRVLEVLIFAQAPFALIGLIRLARRPAYRPFFFYAGLLWLVMSLAFTFPGPRGSFLHSLVAGLPFLMGAVVYGLDWLLLHVAGWRKWQPAVALPVFSVAFVVISLLATAYLAAIAAADWDTRFFFYRRVAAWLEANTAPDDLVMFIDPAGLYYAAGRPSIVATSNTMSETVDILRRYGARYLVLEEKRYAVAWSDWAEGRETVPALELVGQGAGFRAYRLR